MIREIREDDWLSIMEIQQEAYYSIEPESLEVLKSKWKVSPTTCFVFVEDNQVLAYCLSHPWEENAAPDLNTELHVSPESDGIFIHDIAVRKNSREKGIGSMLFYFLTRSLRENNFRFLSLVSIQESLPFWQKLGFQKAAIHKNLDTYGKDPIYMKFFF
jgi:ribosomal protein S18 acetylase RimI-like enzyme